MKWDEFSGGEEGGCREEAQGNRGERRASRAVGERRRAALLQVEMDQGAGEEAAVRLRRSMVQRGGELLPFRRSFGRRVEGLGGREGADFRMEEAVDELRQRLDEAFQALDERLQAVDEVRRRVCPLFQPAFPFDHLVDEKRQPHFQKEQVIDELRQRLGIKEEVVCPFENA